MYPGQTAVLGSGADPALVTSDGADMIGVVPRDPPGGLVVVGVGVVVVGLVPSSTATAAVLQGYWGLNWSGSTWPAGGEREVVRHRGRVDEHVAGRVDLAI